MLKKLMITTALTGVMIGSAAAQSSTMDRPAATPASPPAVSTTPAPAPAVQPAPMNSSSTQFINSQRADQWLASNFKGTDVMGANDEKIGDVTDILFDKTGRIEAFIVSVGGFLGLGAKDVAVAPNAFQVVAGDKSKNESDKLKIGLNKDQLQQAASFEPYKAPTTTGMAPRDGSPRPAPAAR